MNLLKELLKLVEAYQKEVNHKGKYSQWDIPCPKCHLDVEFWGSLTINGGHETGQTCVCGHKFRVKEVVTRHFEIIGED